MNQLFTEYLPTIAIFGAFTNKFESIKLCCTNNSKKKINKNVGQDGGSMVLLCYFALQSADFHYEICSKYLHNNNSINHKNLVYLIIQNKVTLKSKIHYLLEIL